MKKLIFLLCFTAVSCILLASSALSTEKAYSAEAEQVAIATDTSQKTSARYADLQPQCVANDEVAGLLSQKQAVLQKEEQTAHTEERHGAEWTVYRSKKPHGTVTSTETSNGSKMKSASEQVKSQIA